MLLLNVWFLYASYNLGCGGMISYIFHILFLTDCTTFMYRWVSGFSRTSQMVYKQKYHLYE